MNKEIIVDIRNVEDILEKYNNKRVNKKLIDYLINEVKYIDQSEKITIIINNQTKTKLDIKEILINSLKSKYNNFGIEYHRNNLIQLGLLFLGILLIFISSLINVKYIWKEVILIMGWVPIWEAVKVELFKDFRGIRRKNIISKLLESEIIVK